MLQETYMYHELPLGYLAAWLYKHDEGFDGETSQTHALKLANNAGPPGESLPC